MKRLKWLVPVLLVLLLCSCGQQQERTTVFDREYEGTLYTVDLIEQTITYGDTLIHFELPNNTGFRMIYPDGSTWWWDQNGQIEVSDDYDANRYVPGETLWAVITGSSIEDQDRNGYSLIGLVLIAFGGIYALAPKSGWNLSFMPRNKDTGPSKRTVMFRRVCGAAAILAGLIILFVLKI